MIMASRDAVTSLSTLLFTGSVASWTDVSPSFFNPSEITELGKYLSTDFIRLYIQGSFGVTVNVTLEFYHRPHMMMI